VSGFHTATICADCDPPVVAISTGHGSRCPRCGQVDEGGGSPRSALPDGVLARQVIVDTAVRSDGDARLLAELARRLLDRLALKDELDELRDLADIVRDADICALPPELLAVRQRWYAESHAEEVADAEAGKFRARLQSEDRLARSGRRGPVTFVDLLGDASPTCPHCVAGEPSVWDDVLFHYAHPDGEKLKVCHSPWRERCRRCSVDVAHREAYCAEHALEGRAP
jgi:hypothetical protein